MKLSFLKRAMKVLDQILGKMLQIWPKNKLSQAFTQAITKHKKKRNQTIHTFCGATWRFWTKF